MGKNNTSQHIMNLVGVIMKERLIEMNKYLVTLKSGVIVEIETEKNPIGLWVWSTRQRDSVVLGFGDHSILSTEIAMVTPCE